MSSLPAAGAAAALVGDPFADAMRDGAGWVMAATLSWWVNVPSVDLQDSPAGEVRGYLLWLATAVATLGLMWQGILMVVSRRPDPLIAVGRGLFTLVLWAGIGIAAPAAAMRAGDAFSTWVLDRAASGRAVERLLAVASLTGVDSTGAVIVLGLVLMLAGLVQAIIMIFREGAVVVLAGAVVLAASGSMTAATRGWLPRVLGWMAALIAYKPVAALVYATAVVLMGDGNDARTVLVGFTMMLLAIVALPALMRFFSWTTSGISSGGGGLAVLGLASSAASTAAALHGVRADRASQHAARLRDDLGPPGSAAGGEGRGLGPAPSGAGAAVGRSSVWAAPTAGAPAGSTVSAAAPGGAAASTGAAAGTTAAVPPVGAALGAVAVGQAAVGAGVQLANAAADQLTGEAPA